MKVEGKNVGLLQWLKGKLQMLGPVEVIEVAKPSAPSTPAIANVTDPGTTVVQQILADLKAGSATIIPLGTVTLPPCNCEYCRAVKAGNRG